MTSRPSQDWERELSEMRPILVKFFQGRRFPDCESLAQECLLRALKKIKDGKEIDNLGAYVLTIARNVAKETWRSQTRSLGPQPPLRDTSQASERKSALFEAAKRKILSKTERRLLDLYHGSIRGQSRSSQRKKLALSFKITPNALRIRISRILKRLQEEVREPGTGNAQES